MRQSTTEKLVTFVVVSFIIMLPLSGAWTVSESAPQPTPTLAAGWSADTLTDEQAFGRALVMARAALGLSQAQVADSTCITTGALGDLETGAAARPEFSCVFALANWYKVRLVGPAGMFTPNQVQAGAAQLFGVSGQYVPPFYAAQPPAPGAVFDTMVAVSRSIATSARDDLALATPSDFWSAVLAGRCPPGEDCVAVSLQEVRRADSLAAAGDLAGAVAAWGAVATR